MDYKGAVLTHQLLGPAELLDLETNGFSQLDGVLHHEHSFPITLPDVHMDGPMIVAVEEEPKSVFCEYGGHVRGDGALGLGYLL
jgi:hypothetical protein